MKYWLVQFIAVVSSFRLLAGDALPHNLGSGQPGLCIIYNSTNEYIIFIDEALQKSWKPGDDWLPGYAGEIQVFAARNFGRDKLSPNGDVWNTEDLFPFDENTAFTSDGFWGDTNRMWGRKTQVFSTNEDHILVSDDVYDLARARYGLRTNQWFLGKLGTDIYYWETGRPNIVYYRATDEKQAAYYFKLPKSVSEIYGVKRALSSNKDIGFCVDRRLSWFETIKNFGTAAAQPTFIEFSLKDAKRVKRNK